MTVTHPRSRKVEPTDAQAIAAANIRSLLGRYRITQEQLAEGVSLTQRAVSERLNGKTNFTIRELARVALFLDEPLGDLVSPAPQRKSA